jgi:hypothetical protein
VEWSRRDRALYYALRYGGVAILLLALVLSYTLKLPAHVRFDVVGVVGLAGWGASTFAGRFKRPG